MLSGKKYVLNKMHALYKHTVVMAPSQVQVHHYILVRISYVYVLTVNLYSSTLQALLNFAVPRHSNFL